ncbi:Leucine-rich repeat-containing protein LOC400891-like [Durusdinium trenchii]|uniref:Leucine-rich repeat-containing protein LOC400891-like n=1 Tax=Durusdinium trenchii TaxID=1381693 RepID=A0ABP0SKD2_9DINO
MARSLLLQLLPLATLADFHVLPVETDSYCARGYAICRYSLTCLYGYSLECKGISCDAPEETCEDFGPTWRKTDWNGHCDDWDDVERRYECCECVGSVAAPEITSPSTSAVNCHDSWDECPDSYDGSCCSTRLSCPAGYTLSESLDLCGRTDCGLEHYAVSQLNYMSMSCGGIFPGDQVQCHTCMKDEGPASSVTATTTLAHLTAIISTATLTSTLITTTEGPVVALTDYASPTKVGEECDGPCAYSLTCPDGYGLDCHDVACGEEEPKTCDAIGIYYELKSWSHCQLGDVNRYECCRCARSVPSGADWEFVGTPGNGACRGRNQTDNSASYYTVHHGITEIEECKALCLQHFPSCKGIEWSYGRCELWTRSEGIFAHVELETSGFSCMRFGWAAKHLMPVDGGTGRACRGSTPTDNRASYFVVVPTRSLEECRARCTAAPLCYGIEFSLGRCEIWVQPIQATTSLDGFSCFVYNYQDVPVFTEKPSTLIP